MASSVLRSLILSLALAAGALLAAPAGVVQAQQAKQSSFIIDANTGKALHAQSADELRFPASLTKMMTLYILFGEIEQGRLSYDSKIVFSERATAVAPSKLGLDAGDEIEVIDAIKALVVKSANDVAVAVAETIGGSEAQFARLMTTRAREIGMSSTTFRNASGLPNPVQKTTARDMVTLALRLQDDFPRRYRLFATTSFTFRGKTHKTHNTLMRGFPGMDGVKTGYTRASGFNLVSSVQADGKHIVGAVFGGKTAATRNALMRSLLYTALRKASSEKTRSSSPELIAKARPATKTAVVADAGWTPKTKPVPPVKPAKVAVKAQEKAVPKPPQPTPAERPPQHDPIGAVLAQGDAAGPPASDPAYETAAAAPTSPRLDLHALRAAMTEETESAPPPGAGPVAQAAAAPAPQDIAGLIRNSIVEGTPVDAKPVAEAPAATVARAPSTLDQQAAALTAFATPARADEPQRAAPPPPPSHLKGPMPTRQFTPAPVGVGYEIQIGAYGTVDEAQAKLDTTRTRAVGLLDGHDGVTLPVQREQRQIFRARFVRFDEPAATNACLELRRLAIDCFVMKSE
ncbi:MAG: serine hydrolase [Hyphomicrobium sp.]|uniref:D-alanyl-D-alanine carboxypeptidase family protein n=1 Tax=Hyphomicrobium sp. TaxID=82 RepID=UPI003D0F4C02